MSFFPAQDNPYQQQYPQFQPQFLHQLQQQQQQQQFFFQQQQFQLQQQYQFQQQQQQQAKLQARLDSNRLDDILLDTEAAVVNACNILSKEKRIVVDIEGVDLSRDGRMCLLQIASENGTVYLFDVCVLGMRAFDVGLRDLLQNKDVLKLFYDVRGDTDALWHQFHVRAAPILDVQIVHMTAFHPDAPFVRGLRKTLEVDAPWLDGTTSQRVAALKQRGLELFTPERGGSYKLWEERPLNLELIRYAQGDVSLIFNVCDHALRVLGLSPPEMETLVQHSQERAARAMDAAVSLKGPECARRDFPYKILGRGGAGRQPQQPLQAQAQSQAQVPTAQAQVQSQAAAQLEPQPQAAQTQKQQAQSQQDQTRPTKPQRNRGKGGHH